MDLIPKVFKNKAKKEKLYELACGCKSTFLNEAQATEIIDEMYRCNDCSEYVFLVAKVRKSS